MSEAVREHGDALEELSIQVERWKHQIGSCLLHSSLCESLGWQSEDRLYMVAPCTASDQQDHNL